MGRVLIIQPGYRLRDLISCAVVIQLGAAFVYALRVAGPQDAMRIPVLLFAIGLAMLALAFATGAAVDRLGRRYPSLIRPRRCPRLILMGVPLAAAVVALRDDMVLQWLSGADQWVEQLRPLTDQLTSLV